MKFKIGDRVRVRKPDNTEEGPLWVKEMDDFDGKIMTVSSAPHRDGSGYYELDGQHEWNFDERWLSADTETKNYYNLGIGDLQVINVVEALELSFSLGNALKYLIRAGRKSENKTADLRKAIWYLQREMEAE